MAMNKRSVVARGYRWGRGRLQSGNRREFSGVEEAVLVLFVVGVTQLEAFLKNLFNFVKTHRTVHHKEDFLVCKLEKISNSS